MTIVDVDIEKSTKFADEHGTECVATNVDDILDDPKIDIFI